MPIATALLGRTGIASLAAAAATVCALLSALPAKAEDLIVEYDQAKMLRLAEPADSIIIGNPSIADITLKSSTLLVITGKTFGVTNIIILNKDDKIILSERLMVKSDHRRVVGLQKGTITTTYNCMPSCEPIMKVGDDGAYLTGLAKSAETKMKFSEGTTTSAESGN